MLSSVSDLDLFFKVTGKFLWNFYKFLADTITPSIIDGFLSYLHQKCILGIPRTLSSVSDLDLFFKVTGQFHWNFYTLSADSITPSIIDGFLSNLHQTWTLGTPRMLSSVSDLDLFFKVLGQFYWNLL